MKSPIRIRVAALLAVVSLTRVPALMAAEAAPVPPVAPVPPAPPVAASAAVEIEVDDDDASPVREALREAQDDLRGAHEEVARAMRDVQRQFRTVRIDAAGPNTSRLLVVPAADATGDQVALIREDLTIMSRLLQKTASPDGHSASRFRFDFGDLRLGGRADLDALYLDGYGAVFLLSVDYPLSSPAADEPKKAEAKEKKDEAWEKARREVAGKGEPEELDDDADPTEEPRGFDGSKVDRLKQRILGALRSAANIRGLKPQDHVVVQVSGKGGKRSKAVIAHSGERNASVRATSTRRDSAPSVMTFRATGKDVADFNAGRLNAEEFARGVSVTLLDEPEVSGGKPRKF
jgi:hypothetical protein